MGRLGGPPKPDWVTTPADILQPVHHLAGLANYIDAGSIVASCATSDIELDRVEGVHGPRALHAVILHRQQLPG
jgi:L-lactate utilization protein LutC